MTLASMQVVGIDAAVVAVVPRAAFGGVLSVSDSGSGNGTQRPGERDASQCFLQIHTNSPELIGANMTRGQC